MPISLIVMLYYNNISLHGRAEVTSQCDERSLVITFLSAISAAGEGVD